MLLITQSQQFRKNTYFKKFCAQSCFLLVIQETQDLRPFYTFYVLICFDRIAVYLPYCEDLVKNKNFTADVLSVETDVMSMAECAEKCLNFVNDTCKYWFYIENSADKSKSCEIRGDKGTDPGTDVNLNDTSTYFAPKECQKGIDLPSMPEEALELSYKEVCSANQLRVESRLNNTWNKDYCPSK